jgi:SAM-dependent methyltransferase
MHDDAASKDYFERHNVVYSDERLDFTFKFIASQLGNGKERPMRFLDVGCGAGNILKRASEVFGRENVHGMDFSAAYADMARKDTGCQVHEGSILDAEYLKGLGQKYDVVLLSAVLHHLVGDSRRESEARAQEAIANGLSLLNPGGFLIIQEPAIHPRLICDVIFHIKNIVSRWYKDRICIGGYWYNIGAPVVSFYTNQQLEGMVREVSGKGPFSTNIKKLTGHKFLKYCGIRERTESTFVVKRPNEGRAAA